MKSVVTAGGRSLDARWWPLGWPGERSGTRLFCFPFAGSGASVYRTWRRALEPAIDACAPQLPGREARIREPPFRHMEPLANALLEILRPWTKEPFAFFGCSMGALVAYELAHRLRDAGLPGPRVLFVAASGPPRREPRVDPLHALPDAAFMEALRDLEGTPEEVLAHAELMELLLPTLKADFEVCETYVRNEREPLGCEVVAFGGTHDRSVSLEDLEHWARSTRGAFRSVLLPAGHFILGSHEVELQHHVALALAGS